MTRYYCDWCGRDHGYLAPEDVKAIYNYVKKNDAFPNGVVDVRHLEHSIGKQFSSTAEFFRIVEEFLIIQSGTKLTMGQKLKRERKRYRMTQPELGKLLKVGKTAINNYELGIRPLPKEVQEWLVSEKMPLSRESPQR